MSFEIQELPDVIKIVTLLLLAKKKEITKKVLRQRLDNICKGSLCPNEQDVENALSELKDEGLIDVAAERIALTETGSSVAVDWENLFVGDEPIVETVAGLADGSVSGLVVIISSFVAGLSDASVAFIALLTLSSVSITNFSSFFLGSKTEDINDILGLQHLISFSLRDIPERSEREKSLKLVSRLFETLKDELGGPNLRSALISGGATFVAGLLPIALYLLLPGLLGLVASLVLVGIISGFFLVSYRSKRMRVSWRVTLVETVIIMVIAVAASLLLGNQI